MAVNEPAGIANLGLSQVDIAKDYVNRRNAIFTALTTDVEKVLLICNTAPENGGIKQYLCLYGLPDRTWQVRTPRVGVSPQQVPEPSYDINFALDTMTRENWLATVALHCDNWLLRVVFYQAALSGMDNESRVALFERINNRPTLHEIISGKLVTQRPRPQRAPKRRKLGDMFEELDAKKKEEEERARGIRCWKCWKLDGPEGFWLYCFGCGHSWHGSCYSINDENSVHILDNRCIPECAAKPPTFGLSGGSNGRAKALISLRI